MEVSTDNGKTWKGTERDINNFFVVDGVLPTTSAWVKVTSESGSQVVVENVKLESGKQPHEKGMEHVSQALLLPWTSEMHADFHASLS